MNDSRVPSVRRAARIVGLQITIASGALVVLVIAAAALFITQQLQPAELREPSAPGQPRIYIDSTEALTALVVVGVAAVVIAGVLSLILTRRAVQPLGDALRMQRTFVADASHELRTPLAVLDARLQVLQRGLQPDDPSVDTVAELRRDTHALIDIVTDLLLAADNGDRPTKPHPIGPSIEAAAASMRMLAAARDIRILVDGPAHAQTLLPPIGARRCVLALLDNAVGHSPDRSTIRVTTTVEHGQVAIRVSDEGAGITGLDPARVFDRFAHSSPTDKAGRTSFGIGLALVREVATRYRGTVLVEETSGRGTTMLFTIPLFNPPTD